MLRCGVRRARLSWTPSSFAPRAARVPRPVVRRPLHAGRLPQLPSPRGAGLHPDVFSPALASLSPLLRLGDGAGGLDLPPPRPAPAAGGNRKSTRLNATL